MKVVLKIWQLICFFRGLRIVNLPVNRNSPSRKARSGKPLDVFQAM
jgi:hypothetical protein